MPKQPIKVCPGGHRQTAKWRIGDPCWQCDRDRERKERALLLRDPSAAARYRAEETRKVGPIPDVLTIKSADGTVQYFPAKVRRKRR